MTVTEGQIQDDIRLALGSAVLLYRNNVGRAEMHGRWVAFGVGGPGGADLVGCHRGRFVAIEVKTATGTQTKEQQLFQRAVESHGGIYVVLRSAAEARSWLATL